jgi:ribosome-binding factor A
MVSNRTYRVAALVLEELSRSLLRLDDPRLRGVTLTRVRMSKDLKIAHASFSLIGADEDVAAAAEALARARGMFKRAIAQNLKLRYMPELEFHYDKNLAYADRIDRLFRELHSHETGDQGDKDDGPGD